MTNFWAQNLLITQDKLDKNCALFSKPRVCQSFLKMPNPAHPLIPLPGQVWWQSPLVRTAGA